MHEQSDGIFGEKDLAFLERFSEAQGTSVGEFLARQARSLREELEKPLPPEVISASGNGVRKWGQSRKWGQGANLDRMHVRGRIDAFFLRTNICWRIAEAEAALAGFAVIEPAHFWIGVCKAVGLRQKTSRHKTQEKRKKDGPSVAEERIAAKLSEVKEAMAAVGISSVKLRRALRAELGGSRFGARCTSQGNEEESPVCDWTGALLYCSIAA